MKLAAGTTVRFYAFYTRHGGNAVPGLDVRVFVNEDALGIAPAYAVDDGDGWYHFDHTLLNDAYVRATFHSTDADVDCVDIPSLGYNILGLKTDVPVATSVGQSLSYLHNDIANQTTLETKLNRSDYVAPPVVDDISQGVWSYLNRTLTSLEISPDDVTNITDGVAQLLQGEFSATGTIIRGKGRGRIHYTDVIKSRQNTPIEGAVVKCYTKIDDDYIWDPMVAMDITDHAGVFDLFLNPGTYLLSVELAGSQITTQEIVVTEEQ